MQIGVRKFLGAAVSVRNTNGQAPVGMCRVDVVVPVAHHHGGLWLAFFARNQVCEQVTLC